MGDTDALLALVLAAGKGVRFRSRTPKVLHPVCGRPLLGHILRTVQEVGAARTVIVLGPDGKEILSALGEPEAEVVQQPEPLGTGHAVLQARSILRDHPGPVLVTHGADVLYRASTFAHVVERFLEHDADLVLLTAEFPDPTGYGRIVRGPDGGIERIVEERDAEGATQSIAEVNLGVYVARGPFLVETLEQVGNRNDQGEYLMTDVVELALRAGRRVETMTVEDWTEGLGVNSRLDLARAEQILRRRIAEHWMLCGVSFVDPEHTYVDVDVEIGEDTVLEPGCALRRGARVGRGCRISTGSVVEGSSLGNDVYLKPHCWIEDAELGSGCVIGPSAHIRPDSILEEDVRIGNYVEVKNSRIGRGTKADHLAYIGDADVGACVSFGCGAITVNYDGEKKSRTTIGEGAFVGCNANLIAPVRVEAGAYVAAGSTITSPVPEGALGVARARQRNIERWRARRFRSRGRPKQEG